MRSASWLLLLLVSIILIALASVVVAAENPVIVGKWDRTDGADKYTIYANGVTETILPDGTHRGTWDYDGPGGYKYIFHWEHGPPGRETFVDYVTVAADGQSYSGVNNYGNQFHCLRVGGADSTPAAESGFPVIPVAVGGGIAAIAAGGAAVYYFLIAKHGAESAAGTAGAADVIGSGGGQSNEVAFDSGVDPTSPIDPVTMKSRVVSPYFAPPQLGDPVYMSDQESQKNTKFKLQLEEQGSKNDRVELQEKVREQINKTEMDTQQNRTNTQNKIKEHMQQELKDQSQTTQEVADSGENTSSKG